ncbi:hypothetical protein [Streptomyces sp. NPDC018045]|uniref:hypothetical protein n=1 Tax=Streptomyces sp. NPDC018045 TaxID=3365037 RepID=UPI0037A36CAD
MPVVAAGETARGEAAVVAARGEVAVLPWTGPWTCRPMVGVHLVRHRGRRPFAAFAVLAVLAREHRATGPG